MALFVSMTDGAFYWMELITKSRLCHEDTKTRSYTKN